MSDVEERFYAARDARIEAEKRFQLAEATYFAAAEKMGWTLEQAEALLKEEIARRETIHKLVETAPPEHWLVFSGDRLVFHAPDKDAAFEAETAAIRKSPQHRLVFVMPPKAEREESQRRLESMRGYRR